MALNLADRSATLLELYDLHGSGADALSEVLKALPRETLERGQELCAEGDQPQLMWFLLEGSLSVRKRSYTGTKLDLAEVGAPAILGHMGMVDGAPRSATCQASDHCELAVLDRARFEQLLSQVGPGGDTFRRLLIASMTRQLDAGNSELRRVIGAAAEDQAGRGLAVAEAAYTGWKRG